jgi:hypothetical protein
VRSGWLVLAGVAGGLLGAVWAFAEPSSSDGLIGWPTDQPVVATPSPATRQLVDPLLCERARGASRSAWGVMATATRRWAEEARAAGDPDGDRAPLVVAAVDALARGEGRPEALHEALAGTSVTADRFETALRLSEAAADACRLPGGSAQGSGLVY